MKVGDKVWLFDFNRRVYPKEGGMGRSPIYSEHFYQCEIDGETSRSWIVSGTKFSKLNPQGIYNDQQKEERIWDYENRYKIVKGVESCSTKQLKEILSILNLEK